MYASTGDERLKQKGEALVAGLAACQAKFPSGYLSAYPEEFFDRVEKQQQVWAPYYTLHKIFAGLLDMYVLCGDPQALEVAKKFGDWAIARNARLTDDADAGDARQRARRHERVPRQPLRADRRGEVSGDLQALQPPGRHRARRCSARTSSPACTPTPSSPSSSASARQYELTGDESLRTAATFFWNTVVHERSYVIGGNSDGEMFSPKEKLSTAFGPSTTETCNTYNMLKLTRHLFCWDPQVEYADYYERALYNHILASQNPEDGMTCYYVPLRTGSRKTYCDHDELVLVLHRHGRREPREIRRLDLLPRRRLDALREPLHRLRTRLEGARPQGAPGNDVPDGGHDQAHLHLREAGGTGVEAALAVVGQERIRGRGQRRSAEDRRRTRARG